MYSRKGRKDYNLIFLSHPQAKGTVTISGHKSELDDPRYWPSATDVMKIFSGAVRRGR